MISRNIVLLKNSWCLGLIRTQIAINKVKGNMIVEQKNKQPIEQYCYSESHWVRLGCGPLHAERDRSTKLQNALIKTNPGTDGKHVKGYN